MLVVWSLGDRSLWFDEAYTVGTVDRSFGDALWRINHWELNQAPFYALMTVWHRLGDGDAFLRLPAAAFAVATVPAMYVLGRRLVDPWVGALAAGVVAGHALLLDLAQQVRGYSLATLLVVVATLLLLRVVERPSTRSVVAYAVVASVAVYAHVLALLVVAAHGLCLLGVRTVPRRLLLLGAGVGAVVLAPLGVYLVTRDGDPLYWVGGQTRSDLEVLADVAGGGWRHLLVLGGLAALGAAFARTWRTLLPVLWLAVPTLFVLVSTWTVKPLLVSRFLVVVVPALALLVAMGVRRLPPAGAVVAVSALAVVSVQGIQDREALGNVEEWRQAVSSVEASVRPGDDVVAVPATAAFAVRHYGPELHTVRMRDLDTIDGERLWVFDRLNERGGRSWAPAGLQVLLFDEYEAVEVREFTRVLVTLYERR